jgi:hypothetical protein
MFKKIFRKILTKVFTKVFEITKSHHEFNYNKLSLYFYIISKKINQSFTRIFVSFSKLKTNNLKLKKYKIAVVKEATLDILYCIPSNNDFQKMLLTSIRHSGLVGVFTKFNVDSFIVKPKPSFQGTNKISILNQSAIDPASISWSNYDLVIAYNLAISANITQRYPQVIWCYMITEPLMSDYQKSILKPVHGYDLFLNQFSASINLFKQAKHIVNFPFNLQYYGCFHELIPTVPQNSQRSGVFVETFTAKTLTLVQLESLKSFGEVRTVSKDTKTILMDLLKSKYFIRNGGERKIWGNSLIEAVAAGCLAIGNHKEIHNNLLITRQTSTTSLSASIKLINYFERNPQAYEKAILKQRTILNYFFYYKPLLDLQKKVERIKQSSKQ